MKREKIFSLRTEPNLILQIDAAQNNTNKLIYLVKPDR